MPHHDKQLSAIMSAIVEQYRALESPYYGFVRETMILRPYSALVARLSVIASAIKEDTDPNDDVSFGYLLQFGDEQLFLQLSMVCKFAIVQRVRRDRLN